MDVDTRKKTYHAKSKRQKAGATVQHLTKADCETKNVTRNEGAVSQ